MMTAGSFRKGSLVPKEMGPFLPLEKSPELLHPGSYLPEENVHTWKRAKQNVGAAKQPPNIWCLELSLPLGLYCWGVGGNPPSHC